MKKYIVKKYILAESINEAMAKEKKASIDDIYLDKDSEPQPEIKASQIGFDTEGSKYYYSPVLRKRKKK